MKTPRELLLKRHQSANTKLDAVRAETVAALAADAPTVAPGFVAQLWRELFWSCRRVWFGVGAAWAVILVMNVASSDSVTTVTVTAKNTPPATEMATAMRQREMLRAELGVANSQVEATPMLPRPRSDRRRDEMMA